MRICILGNSHVGAIKLAWDDIKKAHPEKQLCFFARGGEGMRDLIKNCDVLAPRKEALRKSIEFTSGGFSVIDPALYDIFLLYGLGFSVKPIGSSLFYSNDVKNAVRIDRFEMSTSSYLFEMLKRITKKAIYIAPAPFESAPTIKTTVGSTDIEWYHDEIEWYKRYFKGAAIPIAQPDITILFGKYTDPKYSRGSLKLETGDRDDGEAHPDVDTKHMNKLYGIVWLNNFFKDVLGPNPNQPVEVT